MTETARQYALAVFQLALEKDALKQIGDCFVLYKDFENPDYRPVFTNPRLSKSERKSLVNEVVKDESYLSFLQVLIDNDRFDLLPAIRLEFENLVREMGNIMKVKVVSRDPLTQNNKERLKRKLESEYRRQIELEEATDPKIIAGFRLEYDGKITDQTINRQLEDLKTNLKR